MFEAGNGGHVEEHNSLVTCENPERYGGVGDGSDATTAIEAAVAASITSGRPVYFPAGVWSYRGASPMSPGVDFRMFGAGVGLTTIEITQSTHLLSRGHVDSWHVHDLTVSGGKGLLHATDAGTNVGNFKVFERLHLIDYTGCAIASESVDCPGWKIRDCLFIGANFANTIGVALAGWPDSSSIQDCDFHRNRVGIKLGRGAPNAHVSNCGFIRWSTERPNGPAVDLWIVPDSVFLNSGPGFEVAGCKFGNENVVVGDYAIVIADQDTGTDFSTRLPDLDSASAGYIDGHTYRNSAYITGGNGPDQFIFSTVPVGRTTDIVLERIVTAGSEITASIVYL